MTHSFPTRRSFDLLGLLLGGRATRKIFRLGFGGRRVLVDEAPEPHRGSETGLVRVSREVLLDHGILAGRDLANHVLGRSEEHTSELQSLMRISYAVFCLKKKQK